MPADGSSKTLFVINPGSGPNSKIDWEQSISVFFGARSVDYEILRLTGEDDMNRIEKVIAARQPATVVAVGGDGTVSMVARQVLSKNIALGILPAGSANGMAKELNIPEDPEAAMQIIAAGKSRLADVIRINDDQICLHLSDIGLNAQLIKHFEEGKLRGKWGYATKVLKTLWTKSSMKVRIVTDNHEVQHVALMVVLANATKYGTGAVINPGGDLYDGQFEVVIMRRLALSELFKMFLRPQPFNPRKIRIFPATSVTIQTKKRMHFQVDGEYLGKVNHVEANILKGHLKLIVP